MNSRPTRLAVTATIAILTCVAVSVVYVVLTHDGDEPLPNIDSAPLTSVQKQLLDQTQPSPECPDPQSPGTVPAGEVSLEILRVRGSCLVIEQRRVPTDEVDSGIDALLAEPDVVSASRPVRASIDVDPERSTQYGLDLLGASSGQPRFWPDGEGIKVAIIDTGISAHPDLEGAVVERFSFPETDDLDDDGHGTHVAGIVAARADNGIGIEGVAPRVSLLDVPVQLGDHNGGMLNEGSVSWPAGLVWAVNHGARVVNMSFGAQVPSITPNEIHQGRAAVQFARRHDVVLVASAGNCGRKSTSCPNENAPSVPAAFDEVISVANVNKELARVASSTQAPYVDLAAPGTGIRSTYTNGAYEYLTGTSQAAPHVAGVVAAMRAFNPQATSALVVGALKDSANDLGRDGVDDEYGHGFVDPFGALEELGFPTSAPTTTLAVRRDVTEAGLRNALFPTDACNLIPAQLPRQMVNGEVLGVPELRGFFKVVDTALGDIDGDGTGDGVAVTMCNGGGTLVAFGVYVFLGDSAAKSLRFGQQVSSAWEFEVYDVSIDAGVLTLRYGASEPDDPHCCPLRDVVETFELRQGEFARTSIAETDAASLAASIATATNRGDDVTLRALVSDAAVRQKLVSTRAGYGSLKPGPSRLTNVPSERSVLVGTDAGWTIEIRLRKVDFAKWNVVFVRDIGGGR
jgi:hypothetical protein